MHGAESERSIFGSESQLTRAKGYQRLLDVSKFFSSYSVLHDIDKPADGAGTAS